MGPPLCECQQTFVYCPYWHYSHLHLETCELSSDPDHAPPRSRLDNLSLACPECETTPPAGETTAQSLELTETRKAEARERVTSLSRARQAFLVRQRYKQSSDYRTHQKSYIQERRKTQQKAKRGECGQKPDVKARQKAWKREYQQLPHVKAARKAYGREYRAREGVKQRKLESARKYRRKTREARVVEEATATMVTGRLGASRCPSCGFRMRETLDGKECVACGYRS